MSIYACALCGYEYRPSMGDSDRGVEEGTDFEDVIRTAVSLGGDCDTLTCIAGGIAEAFYGVPEEFKKECRKRLRKDMLEILDRFDHKSLGKVFSVGEGVDRTDL